jgi:hypothetical protein
VDRRCTLLLLFSDFISFNANFLFQASGNAGNTFVYTDFRGMTRPVNLGTDVMCIRSSFKISEDNQFVPVYITGSQQDWVILLIGLSHFVFTSSISLYSISLYFTFPSVSNTGLHSEQPGANRLLYGKNLYIC